MKIQKFDGTDTRIVLASMVVDSVVVSRVASRWRKLGLFDSRWANLVGGMCVEYYAKYKEPVGDRILGVFTQMCDENSLDSDVVTAIELFIQYLSDEFDRKSHHSDYVLDVADRLFNRISIERCLLKSKDLLDQGRVDDAYGLITQIGKVELGQSSYVEPGSDISAWDSAFDVERNRPLVTYPGDAGAFFGDAFTRGSLYSFMAPDKTGKSFYLLDFAYRAVRKRNRVAFFDTGDNNQDEVLQRLASRSSRLPSRAGDILLPTGWDDSGDAILKSFTCDAVDYIKGYREFSKVCFDPGALRVSCHPNSSLSVAGMVSILADWDRDGWRPDVVIIDYADILAPPIGVKDPQDQIDETWKQLRRLSQSRYCLVMTATQTNAAVYGRESSLIGRRNFSGRKTKLATVNGMIGINMSDDEKKKGMARLNWLVRRKGMYTESAYVQVAGCLAIGNPIITSRTPVLNANTGT